MQAPRKNRSIAELERWTADPAGLARLEALVLVCQRGPFVKSVLGLTDSTERIRRQKRYACSLLLGWLQASSHGGIRQTEDGLDPDNLLDRMLYCYRRYLALFMVPAARADVSFEMFYTLYQAYTVDDVSLLGCENCGSRFVMLRTAHLPICPICAVHHHAQMPAQYRAAMEVKSAVAHQASG
jgi:hypothetical protein